MINENPQKVLDVIQQLCEKYSLRVGQVFENLRTLNNSDLFYVTDENLQKLIEKLERESID